VPSEVAAAKTTPEPTLPVITPRRIGRAESAAESYQKLEGRLLALPRDQVGRVTTDVAQAASIALGALPNLRKLRADFEALGHFDSFVQKLDHLEDCALAAFYADIRALPDANEKETQQLLERGKPIRAKLLTIAEGLADFDVLDPTLVRNIRQGQGNLDTAQDLVALATLFNANWPLVGNKVPFELALVREAGHVGSNLLHAIGIDGVGVVKNVRGHD
jgi:hypothetical protein